MANEVVLKVSNTASPLEMASKLAERMRVDGVAMVDALRPPAIANAMKAVVICRSYVQRPGFDLHVIPSFVEWVQHDESRTALRLTVVWGEVAKRTP